MNTKYMVVNGKIERWKSLFDDMPGFRCDIRTIVFHVNTDLGEVSVEQQFWFKFVRLRVYRSKHAVKTARRFYGALSKGEKPAQEWGHYRSSDGKRFTFWVSVKVWND